MAFYFLSSNLRAVEQIRYFTDHTTKLTDIFILNGFLTGFQKLVDAELGFHIIILALKNLTKLLNVVRNPFIFAPLKNSILLKETYFY